jgi:hypothetical protein
MKLYIVKNSKGEYWNIAVRKWVTRASASDTVAFEGNAIDIARQNHGHVVELSEVPSEVDVNEAEGNLLDACLDDDASAAGMIRGHFHVKVEERSFASKPEWSKAEEDRLLAAYVRGWRVQATKRYVLPMTGTDDPADGSTRYMYIAEDGRWTPTVNEPRKAACLNHSVTDDQLKGAPAWIAAMDKVEVTE